MTERSPGQTALIERLERDEFDSDRAFRRFPGSLAVAGAILKEQGAVVRDVAMGRNLTGYVTGLALCTILMAAFYGAVIGLYQPGTQTLFAAVKMPLIILGTALMCTPTFFVFNAIFGSKLSLGQTLALVLLLSAATTLVLAAFAPIAWFFTVSTRGQGFLVFLHLSIFAVACAFGMRALLVARRYLEYLINTHRAISPGLLVIWLVIVAFVGLQMAWYMRPLLEPGPFHTGERGLFIEALGPMF